MMVLYMTLQKLVNVKKIVQKECLQNLELEWSNNWEIEKKCSSWQMTESNHQEIQVSHSGRIQITIHHPTVDFD